MHHGLGGTEVNSAGLLDTTMSDYSFGALHQNIVVP